MRRLFITASTVALLIALAMPASAEVELVPVDFAGAVTAGTELVLTCPEGYFVQFTAEGQPVASASFYRKVRKIPVAEGVPPQRVIADASGYPVGVAFPVPKGAKYADAALWCTSPEFTVSWSDPRPIRL